MVKRNGSGQFSGSAKHDTDHDDHMEIDHSLVRKMTRSSSAPVSLRDVDSATEDDPTVSPLGADIWCDEAYGEFYRLHGGPQSLLPPPLKISSKIVEDVVRRHLTPGTRCCVNIITDSSFSGTPTADQEQTSSDDKDKDASLVDDNSDCWTRFNSKALTTCKDDSKVPTLPSAPSAPAAAPPPPPPPPSTPHLQSTAKNKHGRPNSQSAVGSNHGNLISQSAGAKKHARPTPQSAHDDNRVGPIFHSMIEDRARTQPMAKNNAVDDEWWRSDDTRVSRGHKNEDERTFRSQVEENAQDSFQWESGVLGRTFVKNKYGCRRLQKWLQDASPTYVADAFEDVILEFPELMMDAYGHFVCERFMELAQGPQLERIVDAVSGTKDIFVEISFSWNGTRAVQRLVGILSIPSNRVLLKKFCDAVKPVTVALSSDSHGNHVIHKMLSVYSSNGGGDSHPFSFIFTIIGDNIIEIGNNRHGCCILQRCVQMGSPKQQIRLSTGIVDNCVALMQDPFGNYVVQCILYRGKEVEHNKDEYTNMICEKIKGRSVELATQKFASNALELCLECAGAQHQENIISELLDNDFDLTNLLQNDYGNYVVQKCLDLLHVDKLNAVLTRFMTIFGNDQEDHIRRIRENLQRKFPQLQTGMENQSNDEHAGAGNNKYRKRSRAKLQPWRTSRQGPQHRSVYGQ